MTKLALAATTLLIACGGSSGTKASTTAAPNNVAAAPAATPGAKPDASAKAGATLRIRQAFLVPREAAGALRVTVSLLQQKPHYLRFAQHPRLVQ